MHYKDLIEAHLQYESNLQSRFYGYDEYMEEKNCQEWDDPYNLSDKEISKLFEFITSWDPHFGQERDKIDYFRCAYQRVYPLFKGLKGETIDNIALDRRMDNNAPITYFQAIFLVFEEIARCFKRYESTDTSKIIHTINPHLFVMWDRAICSCLSMKSIGHYYAYGFMPLMQKTSKKIIESYIRECHSNKEEAVKKISESGGNKTLAKLMDEYNWFYKDDPIKLIKTHYG